MKLLLFGLGRWGANHLRVLHSLPVDLHVVDVQAQQLETARKLGIAADHMSTNPRDFFGVVDAAVVVTPAQTHFELVRDLILAGKDVFVEKPITLVSSEARKLAELAAEKNRILQVGHIFRFDPASQWLLENIQSGQLGRIHMMRGNFSGFKRPRNDSGVAFADAIHFIDLFNYFMKATPARVSAVMHDFLGRGMEDASAISMEYDTPQGPVWATVETNYWLPGKFREVTVIGSKLSAVCDFGAAHYKIKAYPNHFVQKGSDFQGVEGPMQQIECPPGEPLLTELRAFIESTQTRQAPRADGWAGYNSVRVLEAATEAAKSGKTTEVRQDTEVRKTN
jgi:predicted dehydrogenase